MPKGFSEKRERQYEHIKESVLQRGVPDPAAEEIAARTANKQRVRAGETKTASRLSLTDISSQQRAPYRRSRGGSGRTHAQLYEEAKHRYIPGRSLMSKEALEKALRRSKT